MLPLCETDRRIPGSIHDITLWMAGPLLLHLVPLTLFAFSSQAAQISWSTPAAGTVFGPGDTLIASWTSNSTKISKNSTTAFRLCETEFQDVQNGTTSCGELVMPLIQQSAGSYNTSLQVAFLVTLFVVLRDIHYSRFSALPDVVNKTGFYLEMNDASGQKSISPNFSLSRTANFFPFLQLHILTAHSHAWALEHNFSRQQYSGRGPRHQRKPRPGSCCRLGDPAHFRWRHLVLLPLPVFPPPPKAQAGTGSRSQTLGFGEGEAGLRTDTGVTEVIWFTCDLPRLSPVVSWSETFVQGTCQTRLLLLPGRLHTCVPLSDSFI